MNKKLKKVINSIGLDIGDWVDKLGESEEPTKNSRSKEWSVVDITTDSLWAAEADEVPYTDESADDHLDVDDDLFKDTFIPVIGGYKKYIQDNIESFGIDTLAGMWENEIITEFDGFDDHQMDIIIEGNLLHILGEKSYKDLRRDAPNFLRIRDKSRQTPGSHYLSIDENNIISFKTPSHTHPGVTYDQQVKLLDLENLIQHYSGIKKPVEIVRLALEGNIEVHCTDPSWKYWGFQYIGTKKQYAVEPEPRYPKVRNPKLLGAVCKHLDNVLFILPFQNAKIVKDLRIQKRL